MFARGLTLVPSLVVHAEVKIAEQGEEDRIRWKGLLVVCLQQRVRGDLGRTDPIGRLGKRVNPLAERSGHKDPFTSLFHLGFSFLLFLALLMGPGGSFLTRVTWLYSWTCSMAPIAKKGGLTREKHGSLPLDSGATQRVGLSGGNWYFIGHLCVAISHQNSTIFSTNSTK